MADEDEHLAYGELPESFQGRGTSASASTSNTTAGGAFGSIFQKIHDIAKGLKQEAGDRVASATAAAHSSQHRFDSFLGPQDGNDVKWYVDGCGYFWALSVALEQAQETIWILDWWLSPELYLRRPPAKHEQYRVDRILQAAAERGVKVKIIVYKEVAAALTRTFLKPILPKYLVSLFPHASEQLASLGEAGIRLALSMLEKLEKERPLIASPVTVNSEHTKHALEALHPNISVFRHPDHAPDSQLVESSFLESFQKTKLDACTVAELPLDALKALYGATEDTVLYWAHHEKLCIVDSNIAFMGGLDMCFGRWDANQHSIADAHPGDLNAIVWPGQDYNNLRIMDFADVSKYENNKLDRKKSSRAGWSDVSIGIRGPVVEDLIEHFTQRWNFIYDGKYRARKDQRYPRIDRNIAIASSPPESLQTPTPIDQQHNYMGKLKREEQHVKAHLQSRVHQAESQYLGIDHRPRGTAQGSRICQLVRSASKWSHGVSTEHSIANAYATMIRQAAHFIYIENQFFITATGNKQSPVKNTIGAALVERIIRAAQSHQKFQVIVVIPAIPGFAGDLKDDSSLGTRAIMEYQYNSIVRGGHSIMEEIKKAGYEPSDYIRFYNLRNYDRLNTSSAMKDAEAKSGVDYEAARREFDDELGGYQGSAEQKIYGKPQEDDLKKYQKAAETIDDRKGLGNNRWDSVAECYMLNGPDIRSVPWEEGDTEEIDAFVSEELYVHTKVMIVDDRIAICGSANLNDRSQLGYHDSEIALVVEDSDLLDSQMDSRPYRVGRFAATLRRQIMRKHLGLIAPQNISDPDQNFMPPGVANQYDYGSAEDLLVADPLAPSFLDLWQGRAKTNTAAFAKVFHPVPDDRVRTWKDYESFYEKFFHDAQQVADGKKPTADARVRWGHVVKQEFSPGPRGAAEVKDVLSNIKGTLVDMPLSFLADETIARESLTLNLFTEQVYT